jgi:tetratricopeptide (TPR) repeat protein
MLSLPGFCGLIVAIITLSAFALAQRRSPDPVLPGSIGTLHHRIETSSREAQRLFDQGLTLYYGFNREGARRSFAAAAAHDPTAAMPQAGIALALGPNLNAHPTGDQISEGCAAARKGVGLASHPTEKAFASALVTRYCAGLTHDSGTGYAIEMGSLFQANEDDPDAAALYADSLLSLRPRTGEQNVELIAVLELVLRRWPGHVGANHYYIHAMEGSRAPERALASAKRLETVVPAIGHLLHMPSHIYMRVGEYRRAIDSNVRAAGADLAYLKANPGDAEQTMYYEHDIESLAVAAGFAGRFEQSRRAAESTALTHGHAAAASTPASGFSPLRVFVLLRFHRWNEVLQTSAPSSKDPSKLWYHFARSVSYFALKNLKLGAEERNAFEREVRAVPADATYRSNRAAAVLAVFQATLDARLATAQGNAGEALNAWTRAVAAQDRLTYHEPPPVYYPVRESLGAALFNAGRHRDAERVFRDDLMRHPRNGRSLFGLWQTLLALNDKKEAEMVRRQFDEAWSTSDVKLSLQHY